MYRAHDLFAAGEPVSPLPSRGWDWQALVSQWQQHVDGLGLPPELSALPAVPPDEAAVQIARTLYHAATEPDMPAAVRQLLGLMCRRWRQVAGCSWDAVYAAWPHP